MKTGECPKYVWLEKKTIVPKNRLSFALGAVRVWAWDPAHEPKKWVKYKLVTKAKRGGK